MLKQGLGILLLSLVAVGTLGGCTPAPAVTPTAQPSPTPLPTKDTGYGPWELVRSLNYSHAVNLAGFFDETSGITVGPSGEVHYTADGGQTWSQADNSSLCRFGLDIVDETTAWHCGNGGTVLFSSDGGKTWQDGGKFGKNEPDQCRYISFLDGMTGWAAAPDQLGSTADGGKTWNPVALPSGIQKISAIHLRTPSEGYVLDSAGRLYKTRDSGRSWSTASLGLEAGQSLWIYPTPQSALRFADENHAVVVYTLTSQQVWSVQTTDGGETWQRWQMKDMGLFSAIYLSSDGKFLTITAPSASRITLLQLRGQ